MSGTRSVRTSHNVSFCKLFQRRVRQPSALFLAAMGTLKSHATRFFFFAVFNRLVSKSDPNKEAGVSAGAVGFIRSKGSSGTLVGCKTGHQHHGEMSALQGVDLTIEGCLIESNGCGSWRLSDFFGQAKRGTFVWKTDKEGRWSTDWRSN